MISPSDCVVLCTMEQFDIVRQSIGVYVFLLLFKNKTQNLSASFLMTQESSTCSSTVSFVFVNKVVSSGLLVLCLVWHCWTVLCWNYLIICCEKIHTKAGKSWLAKHKNRISWLKKLDYDNPPQCQTHPKCVQTASCFIMYSFFSQKLGMVPYVYLLVLSFPMFYDVKHYKMIVTSYKAICKLP